MRRALPPFALSLLLLVGGCYGPTLPLPPPTALVSDIVYIPKETPLLAAARDRGNRTVNGLGMLLNQARPAFEAWFGILPEITPELRRMIEDSIPS